MTWNIAGLATTKELQLQLLLEETDVAVICETELRSRSVSFPGYITVYPKTSPGSKMRLLLLYRASLGDCRVMEELMEDDVPSIWLEVNKHKLRVGAVYRQWTPNHASPSALSSSEFQNVQLDSILKQVGEATSNQRYSVVLAGDVNLNMARQVPDGYSPWPLLRKFREAMDAADLHWLPTGSTWRSYGKHDGQHRESIIDVIFVSGKLSPCTATLLPDAPSDHFPVLLSLAADDAKVTRRPGKMKKIARRPFHKLRSGPFLEALSSWNWEIHDRGMSPDELSLYVRAGVMAALDIVVPEETILVRQGKTVYLSRETKKMIRERDKARSMNLPSYRKLRNKASSLVKRDKLLSTLRSVEEQGQDAVWDIVAGLSGKSQGGLPLLEGASSDLEAADICNEYYINKVKDIRTHLDAKLDVSPSSPTPSASPSTPPSTSTSPTLYSQPSSMLQSPAPQPKFSFEGVTAGKIAKIIKAMKPKKSFGIDGLPIAVYKMGLDVLAPPIALMCTTSLTVGSFPDSFKTSIIRPLHKGGGKSTTSASSYRPVALLPTLSKVLEKAAVSQIMSYLEKREGLPHRQHGFRAGRSTVTAVASAHASWESRKKPLLAVAAFDLSAAFDTVSMSALRKQLIDLGFLPSAIRWVESYMEGGKQLVQWNGARSKILNVEYGVRQGSVAGPLLFLIVTRNLASVFDASSVYADDTTAWFWADKWEELAVLIEKQAADFVKAAAELGLKVNGDKTQLLLHGRSPALANCSVNIDGADIHPSKQISVLGSVINANLAFCRDSLCDDVRRRVALVRRLSNHIPRGRPLNMVAKALVLGRLHADLPLSANPRLSDADPSEAAAEKLQVSLNNMCRTLLGVKREDKVPISTLLNKCNMDSYNRMAVFRSAMEAWRATAASSPLQETLHVPLASAKTRAAAAGLVAVPAAARNASLTRSAPRIWNECNGLRSATTESAARLAAARFARSCPL